VPWNFSIPELDACSTSPPIRFSLIESNEVDMMVEASLEAHVHDTLNMGAERNGADIAELTWHLALMQLAGCVRHRVSVQAL
jgi:hypothetical protein